MTLSTRVVALSICLLGLGACGDGPADAPPSESRGASRAELEQRLAAAAALAERLEAVRAVKRLQHAYGHYSELGLWHDFADLFSDTAVGHYTQGDLGKEEIRKLFVEQVGQGILGLADGRLYPHIALSPVITLSPDGQSARARWRIVAMLGGYGGGASFARGVYENAYVKEGGVWKVQEITFFNQVGGRYGESLKPTVSGPLDMPSAAFHYEPRAVGTVFTRAGTAQSSGREESFDALAAQLGTLERRAQRLSAESDVLNLQNAYGYYVDRKLWDDVAELFADTGTMEIGQGGVYVGKASIRRGLDQFGPAGLREGEINDYVFMQPIVTVATDGASAKARGVYLGMTGRVGAGAEWREGLYENEYVRDDGVWKIATLHVYPRLVTDYDKGWARDAKPLDPPSAEFPPDRPPTSAYASYPKFVIAPFHFRHPVTGRPPQYPDAYAAGDPSVAPQPLAAATPARTQAELDARLAALERSLDGTASIEAAENLLNAYGYYADEHMWDAAAQLFAPDGWAAVPGVGLYAGRERLRAALQATFGGRREGEFELHQIAQPVAHAAAGGGATRIRARLAEIDVREADDDAYAAGIYEAAVVRQGDTWQIEALAFEPTWAASHSRGWARVTAGESAKLVEPPLTSELAAPDRTPLGQTAPPFPAIADVPFHYSNPVSGRPPARASF
ncbi:MAG TPA: nuclear transport factor 2 family protein [Gammaproteobacteria bacterium]